MLRVTQFASPSGPPMGLKRIAQCGNTKASDWIAILKLRGNIGTSRAVLLRTRPGGV